MEVNTEVADFFSARLVIRIDETKKTLSLHSDKEWRIEKFGHPIHLVRIGQIKCDLNIFIGVFDEDDAVGANVGVFPFAFEKDDGRG